MSRSGRGRSKGAPEHLHCDGIHLSQGRKGNLLLSLEVLDRIRTAGLTARVRFLRAPALAFGTTILGLLNRKQQRNAVATTQNEDHGDDQCRNDPAFPHALNVRGRGVQVNALFQERPCASF